MNFSVGGITPLTCIDYPGHIACVIFTQMCPLRCLYCHNPHLLDIKDSNYSLEYLFDFLNKRKNFLDGVVFSGGEPFAQKNLIPVIKEVKSMGFKIAVHTSGFFTDHFKSALPLIDWVGFDIKAAIHDYEIITNVKTSGQNAFESLIILLNSDTNYEIRTTVYPHFFTRDRILELAKILKDMHVKNYVLQEYRPLQKHEKKIPLNSIISNDDINKISSMFNNFNIRYANNI